MIDDFADHTRPHMARGMHMFAGIAVVVDSNLPMKEIGTAIMPRAPAIRWLLRRLLRRWRPRWYRTGAPIVEEQFIMAAGKLFCTPGGMAILNLIKAGRLDGIISDGKRS